MPSVKLSDHLVDAAKPVAAAMHRSVPKQIEYWAKIGKTAEENPDLPIDFIIGLLLSIEEVKSGAPLEEYKFG